MDCNGELIETTQTFATMAAKIDPGWIEEIGEHLVNGRFTALIGV